jgi:2-keto-4-pentenoate hydratase/2-oxohepta-3-ene-1,7-dioic acid hydratase in catechol pathway
MERKDKEQNKKSTDSWAIKLWKKKKQKSHMPMTSWMTPKTTIYVYFEMWTMIQGQQTPLPLTTWQKKKKKTNLCQPSEYPTLLWKKHQLVGYHSHL